MKNIIDVCAKPMIIDNHTHIRPGQESAVSDFIRAMDKNNVDRACIAPIEPRNPTKFVVKIVKQHPDRFIAYGSVLPGLVWTYGKGGTASSKLETLVKEHKIRGLKLHPSVQNFKPTDPDVVDLVRKAAELGLPVLFHTGGGGSGRLVNSHVLHFDDLALMVPEATIILGHGEMLYWGPYIARKHKNVYLDTTAEWPKMCRLIEGLGEWVVKCCGAHKILYGSDANPENTRRLEENIQVIQNLKISQGEKRMILHDNAAKILNIE